LRQQLLEILNAVVRDTDGLGLGRVQLLHVLPGSDMAVAVNDVSAAILQLGENIVVTYLVSC
jgi:hypothetical protein